MTPEGLVAVMAGAVVVSALALVLQLLILYGLYRSTQATQARVNEMMPRVAQLIESAESALSQGRQQIGDVTVKANEVLTLARTQLDRVDSSLGEVLFKLKAQLERAEVMLDDSLTRVHQTVTTVHTGVMKPLREVSGVAAGVRAALHHLSRGGKPAPNQATHDEEMFI
ncbi:MAG TPA: hypothetical protein DEH78_13310 [Solibacterales bacterium]|nr:hypothetical protein [Bryobacterales bacterium]